MAASNRDNSIEASSIGQGAEHWCQLNTALNYFLIFSCSQIRVSWLNRCCGKLGSRIFRIHLFNNIGSARKQYETGGRMVLTIRLNLPKPSRVRMSSQTVLSNSLLRKRRRSLDRPRRRALGRKSPSAKQNWRRTLFRTKKPPQIKESSMKIRAPTRKR